MNFVWLLERKREAGRRPVIVNRELLMKKILLSDRVITVAVVNDDRRPVS